MMKNRIEIKFRELKAQKKKAFIAFLTAGDPDLETTRKLVLKLADCGVDIVELGVPFSDPMADGPTIQAASQRALKKGVNLSKILRLAAQIRKASQIPLVLMTYYNPVFRYGEERFVKDASRAGVDGVIVPDLPPEEAKTLIKAARRSRISTIFFVAPTSTAGRIKMVSKVASGFIYYLSLTGVTGARKSLPAGILNNIRRIKKATRTPVCVGFGISSPAQVKTLSRFSDGVIVGSAIVKQVERSLGNSRLVDNVARFVKGLAAPLK
jgi:tryptophan synthase alpha chain